MRYALSTLLAVALGLPALAQSGRGPGGRPEGRPDGDPAQQLRELTERLRALEAKMKSQGEQKVEVVVVEKKDGDKKPEVRVESRRADGPPMGQGGSGPRFGPDGPPMGGGRGGNPFNPGGPPMGGGFGGVIGGRGGPDGNTFTFVMAGPDGTPPGFDKLSKDEQEQFRKLMAKMRGGDQPQVRVIERRAEGQPMTATVTARDERREETRKPSVEQRLDQLERAIGDIKRMLSERK